MGVGTGLTQAAWWDRESLDLDPSPALSLSGVVERDARDMVVPELPKVYDTMTILLSLLLFQKASSRTRGPSATFLLGGYWVLLE